MKYLLFIFFLISPFIIKGQKNYLGFTVAEFKEAIKTEENVINIEYKKFDDEIAWSTVTFKNEHIISCSFMPFPNGICFHYGYLCRDYNELNIFVRDLNKNFVKTEDWVWMDYNKKSIKWQIFKHDTYFLVYADYTK